MGSALIEMKQYGRALEILKDGLNTNGTEEDMYDIFKKIMALAFNSEGML